MNKNLLLYFIPVFLLSFSVLGQKLKLSVPFSNTSSFLEPDPRSLIAKISDSEFASLAKTKGGMNGPSEYVLELYNLDLKVGYSVPVSLGAEEDIVEFYYRENELVLLTVNHEQYATKSSLKMVSFDAASGKVNSEKVLSENLISKWTDVNYKAAVKESFENCINSCLSQSFIIPFQYQYHIKFSPDKSKILTYIFDYGQKTLIAKTKLYDTKYNLISEGDIPVDNNFISYGMYPNNRGEIFILNADKLGRIVVIQYDLKNKTNKLLDIQYANTQRENLVLTQLNDDVVYVANNNIREGKLIGIMYSKFDFTTNLVDKINFYELSTNLIQTVATTKEISASANRAENWKHYEITHFIMNEYEKIILVLEKREMVDPTFVYDGSTVNTVSRWYEKVGRINTEGVLMFAFNKEDEIIWENFYNKGQLVDVNIGLLSSSFAFDNTAEGKLRMVYATSDNPSGVLNTIKYVEWDEYSGSRVKDVALENSEKISLLKSHISWWDNKLMVVGRKGLSGKKAFMNLYEFSE